MNTFPTVFYTFKNIFFEEKKMHRDRHLILRGLLLLLLLVVALLSEINLWSDPKNDKFLARF